VKYEAGSIVNARNREWIVQAGSTEDLLLLIPLGGTEDDLTGIFTPLEQVESSSFSLPNPALPGDWQSCQLLQDAMTLGFRSTAGPFRSFGHIAVDPRPYQFVPLILAMRLDPVRLLIADDVGIGKTVEALLIARELIDRGEADGITVLCPPHLAEQWKTEMDLKFQIESELVLGSTASRLERDIGYDHSLFDIYPNTVVSLDYIKNQRRRDEFKRSCRNLVIVDEAHTCTEDFSSRVSSRQLRYDLLRDLAQNPDRHIILLTATPHSGKEGNFKSLLTLLDEEFINLPTELGGDHNRRFREKLANHFVQRRRADIRDYLTNFEGEKAKSPFPDRKSAEITYQLSSEYLSLLRDAIDWARITAGPISNKLISAQTRVQWWSALALLHACSSSPAAAIATLENRADFGESQDLTEIDEIGRTQVLDGETDQITALPDITPGADFDRSFENKQNRMLRQMAQKAKLLVGDKDAKLLTIVPQVEAMLKDGFNPILFCRYIHTAEYLASELRKRIRPNIKVEIAAVTGLLAPEEREDRISDLGQHPKRVLVATDCLSEGINLQDHFNAVIHYDLSWNPTRHEQREGRVDRFGQKSEQVRTLTYYGKDNPVDGIVLKTLIHKHNEIKSSLGISVPVPMDSNAVAEAIFESLLFRDTRMVGEQMVFEEVLNMGIDLAGKWQDAAEREKASRALFAQHSVRSDQVYDIWLRSEKALGSDRLMQFLHTAFRMNGIPTGATLTGGLSVDLSSLEAKRKKLDDICGSDKTMILQPRFPAPEGEEYILRTHPLVSSLAETIFADALDANPSFSGRRCGVVVTADAKYKTVMILTRLRFIIRDYRAGRLISEKIAEDSFLACYEDDGSRINWLNESETSKLKQIKPSGNLASDIQRIQLQRVINQLPEHRNHLLQEAQIKCELLLKEHQDVRQAARRIAGRTTVELVQGQGNVPIDIIGIYLIVPGTGRGN